MEPYGNNGFPLGTICELVVCPYVEYVNEMCEVVRGRKWHSGSRCYTYEIHLFKVNRWFEVAETQLRLNNLPTKWQNWCENKITRLLMEVHPTVAYELGLERLRGSP